MPPPTAWVDDENAALFTDLYQLTMVQAYWREGMGAEASFSLFARCLPETRNYLLACGLEDVLRYLESVRFTTDALDHLSTFEQLSAEFLEWLARLRFTGTVHALPEGTPVFAGEPILEISAPIAEAQLVESFVMNQIHLQTVLASKAARVVAAARGRTVVDFALRRTHGRDAAVKAARAFHVAGVDATSNVLAGRIYGLRVTGTMAHSYVQAHDVEREALRAFATLYPGAILLVDTYDTLDGVRKIVSLHRAMGAQLHVGGIRLDSGDLAQLAPDARRILDEAGLVDVRIFASGGLDEHTITHLVDAGAPIDGFGVGTEMGVSRDAPALDLAYKLTSYAGAGRVKLSPGKPILPGRKQVFRMEEDGRAVRDVIGRANEELPGRPLLVPVMHAGRRLGPEPPGLDEARARARDEIARLPDRVRALAPADPPYPVELSDELARYQSRVVRALGETVR